MNDDHIKSEISPYLAGGLTESRNRQIEAHVASCEKCRNALTKAKSKQARVKREALKKASTDPLPNLFLARQGKDTGVDRVPSNTPWIVVGVLLIAGAGYGLRRHLLSNSRMTATPAVEAGTASVETSSAPSVAVSVPVPVAPTATKPPPSPIVHAEPVKPPVDLTVQKEWKGLDSAIQESKVVVVRNQESWESLWTDMKTASPLPTINFDDHVVIGVFAGEHPSGSSVVFGTLQDNDENVLAPYRLVTPEVTVSTTAAPGHPYVLALLPRVNKKIRLTQREASQ